MKNDLRRLIASLGDVTDGPDDGTKPPGPRVNADDMSTGAQDLDALRAAQQVLARRHVFRPGMLVRWKTTPHGLSLSNRLRPQAAELSVVVAVLDTPTPLVDEEVDSGSPSWREPLDLALGLLDEDGDFMVFHFDSSRFEPAPAQAARQPAARRLRELQAELAQRPMLQPGMLVRWKPQMKNRKWPAVGQAAVVLQVLAEPCFDPEMSAGGPYFREPLDLVLGVMRKGGLQCMHTDSRRFEALPDDGMPAVEGTAAPETR